MAHNFNFTHSEKRLVQAAIHDIVIMKQRKQNKYIHSAIEILVLIYGDKHAQKLYDVIGSEAWHTFTDCDSWAFFDTFGDNQYIQVMFTTNKQ